MLHRAVEAPEIAATIEWSTGRGQQARRTVVTVLRAAVAGMAPFEVLIHDLVEGCPLEVRSPAGNPVLVQLSLGSSLTRLIHVSYNAQDPDHAIRIGLRFPRPWRVQWSDRATEAPDSFRLDCDQPWRII